MVTDSAQHHQMPTSTLARVGEQVRQFICGLHGHDALLHFEHGRLALRCTSCGHETPGWDVRSAPVRHESAKPRMARVALVREQRIA